MKISKIFAAAAAVALFAGLAFAAPMGGGEVWSVTEHVKQFGETTTKFGSEKTLGNVTVGANVKGRYKGTPIKGTIGDTATGYIQVSNGNSGSIKFTVKAGTSKITVCAKLVDGKGMEIKDGKNTLKTFKSVCKSDYEDIVFEHSFASDTEITISATDGTNFNLKAIKVE